jgi:hypothetical protein
MPLYGSETPRKAEDCGVTVTHYIHTVNPSASFLTTKPLA